ncbi:CE1759 family FMN reductase [Brachybacterium squillarum]|uniref:CE1759 family FMN reductase n=1 Tax=Brachybacterium squillarum TaxID=661979 RepID=UPI002223A725|nr:CE1759 family FMN reductase [Brachybacterium squillarum]MCW1804110.1 NAD(P)H-dependent oxidoreductase [Brachybacterium squillarum]
MTIPTGTTSDPAVEPLRLVVLTAGLSTPSSTRMLADELTRAVTAEAGARPVSTVVVELREHAHEITDLMLTRFPGERLSPVIDAVRRADAVIAVTPVFNIGPSGLFKMFVDAVDKEIWNGRPVLLGATAGTARHSLAIDYALRPMFASLKAELAPTAVFAASTDFGADAEGQGDEQPLAARIRRAARELLLLVAGTSGADDGDAADAAGTPADPAAPARTVAVGLDDEFADFVPLGSLLGR